MLQLRRAGSGIHVECAACHARLADTLIILTIADVI